MRKPLCLLAVLALGHAALPLKAQELPEPRPVPGTPGAQAGQRRQVQPPLDPFPPPAPPVVDPRAGAWQQHRHLPAPALAAPPEPDHADHGPAIGVGRKWIVINKIRTWGASWSLFCH